MVRDAWQFLTSEVRGLQKAAYVLAVCALLSSLLALLRDRLLAGEFGASTTLDLYYAAFRIPDLIFVAIGALVSVYMLIPELSRRTEDSQKTYIDTIIVGFCILAIVLSSVAALLAPQILTFLFPQFIELGLMPTLILMTRIMLLQPILLGFSNILAAITQIKNRYMLYAISPLVYNLGIIGGLIFLYPVFGLVGLAIGVVAGAALHALIQVPSIINDGFLRRMPRLYEPEALMKTITISLPRAVALSMNQLTMIGITVIAGTLAGGSIAVYMFSFNLQAVPLAIIGASYSVAAFPTLATALSRGDRESFMAHVATAARYVFFWSLPVIALIVVLRAHIVRVILGSGNFDWTDTRLTAAAFAILSLALVAHGLTLLLVRAYYAAGRTLEPLLVSIAVALSTVTLGWMLVNVLHQTSGQILDVLERFLRVQDLQGTSVLALAFSSATVAILGAAFLAFNFNRHFEGFIPRVMSAFYQGVAAALAAGVSAYFVLAIVGQITFASTTASVLTRGFVAGAIGIIVAALVYKVLRSRELDEILAAVQGKLTNRPVPDSGVPIAGSAEEVSPSIQQ